MSDWWANLAPVEKLLVGMFGTVAIGVGAAIGITFSNRGDSADPKSSFSKFQKGVAISNLVWQAIDPLIKKGVGDNVAADKGRYVIDQVLDILNVIATSDKLNSLFR